MTDAERARLAADAYFDRQNEEIDLTELLAGLGDARSAFYARLAARVATASFGEGEEPGLAEPSAATEAQIWRAYETIALERGNPKSDLRDPGLWMEKEQAFGGDRRLLLKFAHALVSEPSRRFLRYAADTLGTSFQAVSEHFASGGRDYMAVVERKASGRQDAAPDEDFGSAVRNSRIPDHLKARWL